MMSEEIDTRMEMVCPGSTAVIPSHMRFDLTIEMLCSGLKPTEVVQVMTEAKAAGLSTQLLADSLRRVTLRHASSVKIDGVECSPASFIAAMGEACL